ncbi:MAG: pyrroloquinoline quinone-dependent dehydrogenase [Cyclobacteriaceae bacterium]
MNTSASYWRLTLILFFLTLLSCGEGSDNNSQYQSWEMHGGDQAGTRYSSLDQINKENVGQLEVAWRYMTGDWKEGKRTTIQCNPIIIGRRMFITTPKLKLVALEADTGKEIWVFDPFEGKDGGGVNRGVTYWSDGKEERLYYGAESYLYSIDAKTGKPAEGFADQGRLDLRMDLDREEIYGASSRAPGMIFGDKIIIGTSVGEGPSPGSPGHIRAFNVRTGKREWIFHTIPHPGEFGYETWSPDSWKTNGGANSWNGFTLDKERGIVYFGTGSASNDHWGGDRIGENLFANSVMALNAETGERVWHFQVVHHDLWDYDISCAPTLVSLTKDGKKIDAVAQPTKMGHLFVLDRETGEPVFPVEERPVPKSEIPGEESWPTQPFPPASLVYSQQIFEVTDLNPEATKYVEEQLKNMVNTGIFPAPGFDPAVILPQFNGGSEWGGAGFDPESNTLILNASNEAEWMSMRKTLGEEEVVLGQLGKQMYQSICSSCHGTSGKSIGAPVLTGDAGVKSRMKPDEALAIIESGKGVMPSFKRFSETEKKAILAYLFDQGVEEKVVLKIEKDSWRNRIPYVSTGHWDWRDPEGYPVNKRPWGTLNAIDLNEGKIKWQVPLGTYPALEARGLPATGTFNIGGPVVTAGGLIFIGAAQDERMHAFDKETGELLWEYQMDAGGYATPATYEVDGRQYVIIAAGGGGKPGTKSRDSYYCFALPAE